MRLFVQDRYAAAEVKKQTTFKQHPIYAMVKKHIEL